MEKSSQSPSIGTPITPTSQNQSVDSSNASKPPLPTNFSKKTSRQVSDVWDHFTRIEDNPNDPRAICNYCQQNYAAGHRIRGTSTLRNHLMNLCQKYPFRLEDKKQKTLIFQKKNIVGCESVGGSNLVAVVFNQNACRLACAKMIIIDELAFRFVEQEGFKLFCSVACPKFDIPSRVTIARDIMKLYNDEKKKLRDYFVKNSQRVSLTTDTWTSIQNFCYMVLTSHFIDHEWKMQKRILNFCQIANHKGEKIGKAIETCLKDWGIEKVFAITVDNASSNNVAIIHIKKRLQIWKSAVCDGEFLHMRCSAHILNLIVSDGLKDMDDSIAAVRNALDMLELLSLVKSCLSKLISRYSDEVKIKNPPEVNSTQSGSSIQEKVSMIDSDDDDSVNMFESEFDKECDEDDALDMKNELDRYFMDRNEDRKQKDFDILVWWKMNSSKYPILSEMARDVLAIQVSTVASESAFSTGGRVLDPFRSSLSPKMVQALICCQNWLRSSPMPLDMSSILEDIETYQSCDLGK
uniref:BED-type domain-containing protein n=1 Tax=Cannabis sativa TaxID=3483 RepID=A0A803PJE3_CANSA